MARACCARSNDGLRTDMSLILEALRKSEAERRRAQAPDLFAPAQVAVAPVRRLPHAWVLVSGALLALVAAWLLARGLWPASESRDAPISLPRPAAATPVPSNTGTPERPTPRLLPTPALPPVAVADATTPAPTPRPDDSNVPNAVVSGDDVVEAEPPPAPPPASPMPAVAEPAPAAVGGDTAPPMRLSELAADARRQLPPLKLTMHMWNEAADRRFVILDGRRLAEGDRIGTVRVNEIRRDGVVLDWNGQRLELPLR